MTFFHFVNCVALAAAPYFIVYKFAGLAEYSAFWRCGQAGAVYLVTQLIKLLTMATFFPTTHSSADFDVWGESLRCAMDVCDLVGMYVIMNYVIGRSQLKFLVTAVGWGAAELVMTRALPLWIGARGMEFDWMYIQMSLDSNILLLQHVSTAGLVWLYTRHDLPAATSPVVVCLLVLCVYRSLIAQVLMLWLSLGQWWVLALKALISVGIAVISLQLHSLLQAKCPNIMY